MDSLLAEAFPGGAGRRPLAHIGIRLGGQTPAEVAVSIAAELVAERARLGARSGARSGKKIPACW